MNAPPFPLNPNVGQRFGQWVWSGARWACSPATGVMVNTVVFNASGPYMPSPGLVTAVVETIGGGGGGGAVVGNALGGGNANTAGGGGSGGYSRKTLPAALVAGGVQVNIGQGGLGADTASFQGTIGGVTSFGALCTSNGGSPGGSAINGGSFSGGSGALPGVGDIAQLGAAGESGTAETPPSNLELIVHGGTGGTVWGGSSPGFDVGEGGSQPGNVGWPNTGAGGTGGAVFNGVNPAAGGDGGSGICIVTEYCWMDAGDSDCGETVNVNARVAVDRDGWRSGRQNEGDFGDE
jgi:hypothetical protein